MKRKFSLLINSLALLTLILAACGQSNPPVTIESVPTIGQVPASTNTAAVLSTDTPLPTPDNKMAATPTAPAQWFTPGAALEESDFQYYTQLLPVADDTNPPVLVTGASGWAWTPCETCDLVTSTYLSVTHTTRNVDVNLQIILFRYITMTALQENVQTHTTEILGIGNVQVPVPTSIQLPPETMVFTTAAGDGMTVISVYGAFEIMAVQATLNDLTQDESIEFFCRLVELQISKLEAAGY